MPSADVIINNARIFTGDESNPHAEAVAVKGNRIVYVGTNEGAGSYKDKSTRVIDGQGHTLTPGFWEAVSNSNSGAFNATAGFDLIESIDTPDDLLLQWCITVSLLWVTWISFLLRYCPVMQQVNPRKWAPGHGI